MKNYTSKILFSDKERGLSVVRVQTHMTFYAVSIGREVGTIVGPGIEETFDRRKDLSPEAEAIIAIVQLEDSL